jgi:uncharacterized membrane-anchored protein YjiN (DUF445 family)
MTEPNSPPDQQSGPDSFPDLLKRHYARKLEGKKTAPENAAEEPQKTERSGWLMLLMVLPWLLAAGFVISFYWDFDGLSLTAAGYTAELDGLLRILCISGLIGFTTNWLAIRMLFYPRKRRPLLGQGLIPAQKDRIAERLSVAVERELINPDLIKKEFEDSGLLRKYTQLFIFDLNDLVRNDAFRADVNELIAAYLREALNDEQIRAKLASEAEEMILESVRRSTLERNALKLYLLMKGKTLRDVLGESLDKLPERMDSLTVPVNQLIDSLPARLRKERSQIEGVVISVLDRVIDQINIRKIITDNINRYDEQKLEKIIRDTTDTHLNYIKYLGALIGTVGGLVIWSPLLSLIVLSASAAAVWATDRLLQPR